jgi:hypothetical protein
MTISFKKVPLINSLSSILSFMFWLMIFAHAEFVSAEAISPPAIMEITVRDNLITAELINAPLIDVLQKIKKEFGFKAHFYGDLGELVTLSFSDMPLDKCLRQLTANHSISVVSGPTTMSTKENMAKQITEIWVFSKSTTSEIAQKKSAGLVVPSPDASVSESNISENSQKQPRDEEQEDVLSNQQLNTPDEEIARQRQVIRDLAATGDAASVAAMAEFLTDENKELRRLSVDGISSVNNEESTQILGQVLQEESDPEIRKIAVWALGQRKNDAQAQALLKEAQNDTDEDVKTLADQLLNQ